MLNIKAHFFESNSNEEIDDIAKLSTNALLTKDKKKQKCGSPHCVISSFDDGEKWTKCDDCKKWLHLMCESIPDADFEHVDMMPHYSCMKCQGYDSQNDVYNHTLHQIHLLDLERSSLESEIPEISDICEKYREDEEISMGDSEKQLLRVLDEIGVKRQAYHGDVFIGNHCKVILR